MFLKELTILNYKNLKEVNLQLGEGINCFIGQNGMGKTNLLDAIYYLSFCKSHSTLIDSQNIEHSADYLMIQGEYVLRGQSEQVFVGIKRRQKKQFKRNKKEYERLADHIGFLPLVLISPADAELISEGSEERRKFMDGVISQYNRSYLTQLLNYNNALKQRNALLKLEAMADAEMIEVWEDQMALYAQPIFEERTKFIEKFIPIFQSFYRQISDNREQVALHYTSQLQHRNLKESLGQTRERDHIVGYSTQGVHKDELEMMLGDYPIKRVGSQGQNKTYLIALKLAQYFFLKETQGVSPILLLDDIFAKLDATRTQKIIELVSNEHFKQIFITDTNREHLQELLPQLVHKAKLFWVENGLVTSL